MPGMGTDECISCRRIDSELTSEFKLFRIWILATTQVAHNHRGDKLFDSFLKFGAGLVQAGSVIINLLPRRGILNRCVNKRKGGVSFRLKSTETEGLGEPEERRHRHGEVQHGRD